jgi:hypothetical protein
MKTKFLVGVLLVASCLTSWAWYPPTITQQKINQIRLGQTTEPDLVHLFGVPTTRYVDIKNYVSIDWFRSVPIPPQGYIPILGPFIGALNVEAQQLTVILSPSGRVVRYEVHSSRDTLHASTQVVTTTTVQRTGYAK